MSVAILITVFLCPVIAVSGADKHEQKQRDILFESIRAALSDDRVKLADVLMHEFKTLYPDDNRVYELYNLKGERYLARQRYLEACRAWELYYHKSPTLAGERALYRGWQLYRDMGMGDDAARLKGQLVSANPGSAFLKLMDNYGAPDRVNSGVRLQTGKKNSFTQVEIIFE